VIAPSGDFGNGTAGGDNRPAVQGAFDAALSRPVAPVETDRGVPFDVAIGREVARQVSQRGVRSRLKSPDSAVDAAAVALEPEVIGGKSSPQRRCIVTGDILSYEQMIRFVVGPDGVITPDLAGHLPGRGYWVTAKQSVLARAIQNDAFSRAARHKVIVPPALMDQVVVLARRACLDTLGLARRAWAVDYGYEAVRQALLRRKSGLVLVARNAPTEFAGKLDGVRGETPLNTLFTTAELSVALGRESLAFVAVAKGQWTLRLMIECSRLAQVLTQ